MRRIPRFRIMEMRKSLRVQRAKTICSSNFAKDELNVLLKYTHDFMRR